MKQSLLLYGGAAVLAAVGGFFVSRAWLVPTSQPATTPVVSAAAPPVRAMPDTLPEFSLKNRAGELQSVHSWPEKSLILNFWATWCAPCRREIPLLKELQREHGGEGFQVVGIAVDFREDVLKYADQMQIDYPLLIGEQDGLNAVDAFGIEAVGFPFTVFTDRQGRIITTHLGELRAGDAKVILEVLGQVNRGELTPAAARAQIAKALNGRSSAKPPDDGGADKNRKLSPTEANDS